MFNRAASCMRSVRHALRCLLLFAALIPSFATAETVTLPASKDATLYQSAFGDISNGGGQHVFVGRTNTGNTRRALIRFDLSSIPAGATVTAASIRLNMSRTVAGAQTVTVKRVLADWGEGSLDSGGNEGGGGVAQAGDTTWLHRYRPSMPWATAGGDFHAAVSASTSVSGLGLYTWSGAGLVADVQGWLDAPATNFGWIFQGNEGANRTAKRFDSLQNPTIGNRPALVVTYMTATPSGACCVTGSVCASETQAGCLAMGGTYEGDGSACEPDPCAPAVGACCYPGGICSVTTMHLCHEDLAAYQGDGTGCASGLCPVVLEPFVDALPIPPAAQPVSGRVGAAAHYEVPMRQVRQELHRDLPLTTVWGYYGSFPGPTIEASAGNPVTVTYVNDLRDENGALRTTHFLDVDHCPMHAMDEAHVVPHLHGGHVPPEYDGYPMEMFPPGEQVTYVYANDQLPASLWVHDHAMGITRLNVMMGLAFFYIVRDQTEQMLRLPSGAYEIPLAIQDRSFNADGSLRYPAMWHDHFFGDTILVNGKVWPYLNVRRGAYRFRMLNGCNSRVLTLSLSDGAAFRVVGSDGGLLAAPEAASVLTIAPGERADVVINFAGYRPGTAIRLVNSAPAPYPGTPGEGVVPDVMQFVVGDERGYTAALPEHLRPLPPVDEASARTTRELVLRKVDDECTGEKWAINDLGWMDISEAPHLGTAEIWSFVNQSGISHPMHMHLMMFRVLDRQPFSLVGGVVVPSGPRVGPIPIEAGWKDTVRVDPFEIVRVLARFDDFTGLYPYHCHILEHEDHEMMRQFHVVRFGDADGDGDVGLSDHAAFVDCLGGPGAAPAPPSPATAQFCLDAFDFDADQDVDLRDGSAVQASFVP